MPSMDIIHEHSISLETPELPECYLTKSVQQFLLSNCELGHVCIFMFNILDDRSL